MWPGLLSEAAVQVAPRTGLKVNSAARHKSLSVTNPTRLKRQPDNQLTPPAGEDLAEQLVKMDKVGEMLLRSSVEVGGRPRELAGAALDRNPYVECDLGIVSAGHT